MHRIAVATLTAVVLLTPALSGCGGSSHASGVPTTASTGVPTPGSSASKDWRSTADYQIWCDQSTQKIDPDLAAAAKVTVPDGGHVQQLWLDGNSVVARLCAPISGNALKKVAEDLAIGVRRSSVAPMVATMSVHALPDSSIRGARLRDSDFQGHLHDGSQNQARALTAWTVVS